MQFIDPSQVTIGNLIKEGTSAFIYEYDFTFLSTVMSLTVYYQRGTYKESKVAVKQIKGTSLTPEVLKQAEEEVQHLTILRHPNLVEFIGAVVDAKKLLLVTKYPILLF